MSHRQYDAHRLEQLRSMEHRDLAAYALAVEEQFRMRTDRTSVVAFFVGLVSLGAGIFVGTVMEGYAVLRTIELIGLGTVLGFGACAFLTWGRRTADERGG